jgi:predicted alpha/beta hydrolase family esterase
VSKFVAKFRKDRDYSDDSYYGNFSKKNENRSNRTKKLIKYDNDAYLSEYESEFVKPARKKAKRFD